MSKDEIAAAEELLLGWLREADHPIELLRRDRPDSVSPLGIRHALWNIVDRGVARLTPDECLEPVRP